MSSVWRFLASLAVTTSRFRAQVLPAYCQDIPNSTRAPCPLAIGNLGQGWDVSTGMLNSNQVRATLSYLHDALVGYVRLLQTSTQARLTKWKASPLAGCRCHKAHVVAIFELRLAIQLGVFLHERPRLAVPHNVGRKRFARRLVARRR